MTASFRDDLFIRARLCRSGRYAETRLGPMYYETYGEGPVLFLHHGGLSCLDTFRFQIPALARHFSVIVPERAGHGHTPDRPGECSYESMADEVLAFMDALGIEKADAVGYSDGANLMIPLLRKRPEAAGRFVSVGGNFHADGLQEEFKEELRTVTREVFEAGLDRSYVKYSPDGAEHAFEVFCKVRRLWMEEPRYRAGDLANIRTPALIMAGDRDSISLEHTVQFFKAMPFSQLAVIPGTTHSLLKEKPDLVNGMILDFLRHPFPYPDEEEIRREA